MTNVANAIANINASNTVTASPPRAHAMWVMQTFAAVRGELSLPT